MSDYESLEIIDDAGKLVIGKERLGQIDAWFDRVDAWLTRLEPITNVLDRLRMGGAYAAVAHDPANEAIVFINHDGSRFARSPEQLAKLFLVPARRPVYRYAW